MPKDERPSHIQQTFNAGNYITGGTFHDSPVTNVRNDANPVITGLQRPWLEQLRLELARAGALLAEDHNPAVSADDRDDAIEAISSLETELSTAQNNGQADRRDFRRRVKALIGNLAPVAEIIGGVAAFEAILQHL